MAEFWHDKVDAQRGAIDKFITPIITDALQRKAEKAGADGEEKEETLLSHLLQVTDGACMILSSVFPLGEVLDVMLKPPR